MPEETRARTLSIRRFAGALMRAVENRVELADRVSRRGSYPGPEQH